MTARSTEIAMGLSRPEGKGTEQEGYRPETLATLCPPTTQLHGIVGGQSIQEAEGVLLGGARAPDAPF